MLHRLAWRLAGILACSAVLVPSTASGNGRPPGTSSINFQRGDDSVIAAGLTFGLVLSRDGGTTWHWVCEDAIGYAGTYDPDYAFAADGTLFGTTFDGLVANRDGCTYATTSLGKAFLSTITIGPTGAIHAAAADDADGKIYKSIDGGMTFPVSTMPGQLKDWWASIEVAPSDPNRVYLSGFRLAPNQPKVHLLFRSTNGGASFTAFGPTTIDDFTVMPNSSIEIAGISPTNPDIVFARVALEDNSITDAIYRSTDGGTSWTKLVSKRGAISFLVRSTGQLVLATQQVNAANGQGAFVSSDNGDTWTALPDPPHISCLEENAAGEVWACTQNYGMPGVPSDGFGIMKSSGALATWTGVLHFQDIAGPLACADGTVQKDTCDEQLWCGLCGYIGCDPKRDCPMMMVVDAPPDAGTMMVKPPKDTCCGTSHAESSLALGTLVAILLGRRRRRCSPDSTASHTARSTSRS